MLTLRSIKNKVPYTWKRYMYDWYVASTIKHAFGLKSIKLKDNEVVVTCLVKNGEYYIKSFIEHYINLGVRHIVLLDNGSNDETISLARKYSNVSVFRSDISVSKYQSILKRVIAKRTVIGGWCLDVDIDEYFDYPYSNLLKLNDFVSYLNANKYTAVVTQMLDMFSDKPLSALANKQDENMQETYRYYDLSSIDKIRYSGSDLVNIHAKSNVISNSNICLYFGGIRKALYGINCLLTKHSLFSMKYNLSLFTHVHFVDGAMLADLSCVLVHYKLISNALETSIQNRDSFSATSNGYASFIDLIANKPDYCIKQVGSAEFRDINELISNEFLCVSDGYLEYLKECKIPSFEDETLREVHGVA